MAAALSGCIIIEEGAMGHITYRKKCDKCGYVLPGSCGTTINTRGTKLNSSFQCPKCRTQVKLILQG